MEWKRREGKEKEKRGGEGREGSEEERVPYACPYFSISKRTLSCTGSSVSSGIEIIHGPCVELPVGKRKRLTKGLEKKNILKNEHKILWIMTLIMTVMHRPSLLTIVLGR